MDLTLLLGFWGISAMMLLVPGPDWAFILSGAAGGRRVLPSALGLMLGYTIMTGLVAFGLAALLAAAPAALSTITLLGAGYLVFLGVRGLLRPATEPNLLADPAARIPAERAWRSVLQGIGVSGLNPKGLMIFVALLPQFTDPAGSWALSAQLGVLGLAFVISCGVFSLGLGFGARRVLGARPGLSRITAKLSWVTMVLLGGALLAETLLGGVA